MAFIELGGGRFLLVFEKAAELFGLAGEPFVTAEEVDGAVLGGAHQPGPRVPRDAFSGPLFERGDESLLRQVFRQAYIADIARQPGDKPG